MICENKGCWLFVSANQSKFVKDGNAVHRGRAASTARNEGLSVLSGPVDMMSQWQGVAQWCLIRGGGSAAGIGARI